jgi:hypothetical protein
MTFYSILILLFIHLSGMVDLQNLGSIRLYTTPLLSLIFSRSHKAERTSKQAAALDVPDTNSFFLTKYAHTSNYTPSGRVLQFS